MKAWWVDGRNRDGGVYALATTRSQAKTRGYWVMCGDCDWIDLRAVRVPSLDPERQTPEDRALMEAGEEFCSCWACQRLVFPWRRDADGRLPPGNDDGAVFCSVACEDGWYDREEAS